MLLRMLDAPLPPAGTLRRTVALVQAFRLEQTEPDTFYGLLAQDSVREVSRYSPLAGRTVLDVGGGPGYFADAFAAAGARYLSADSVVGELAGRFGPRPGTVVASGLALPFPDSSLDVCYSSNVLEHVPEPERMAAEMVRVTRPAGVVFCAFTVWLSPWGGHETSPWHYLGGWYAARRYERRYGHPPKNVYGRSLFPLSAGRMVRWARGAAGADLIDCFPRYHPRGLRWIARVPGLREVATANLVLVLRKHGSWS
jgi:SAM-dependent methyltransferase